jgi:hypothetical protein
MYISCSEEPHISSVSQTEEAKIREIGQSVTNHLLKTLQTELKTTIANDGMLAALSVCNDKAINLTESVTQFNDNIIEIKRTSFRFRNPENAPDTHERKTLSYYQSTLLKTGHLPEDIIEKIDGDSLSHYRYYKPLVIKSLCLNCHGQSDMIAPEISDHLKKLYPKDHATGYKIDYFRGLIRVSIKLF